MQRKTSHSSADFEPRYNVKAVARLVGIPPVTLRAWERRYGLPEPQRGSQGYRLYSDYDVRMLRWLKAQTEMGMSIGRAARYLADLRASGADPAQAAQREAFGDWPTSLENLMKRCLAAWTALDEDAAAEALRLAFSLYPVDQVLMGIVRPALVDLGERWHRGEAPVAVEHFATQFCLRHLLGMYSVIGQPSRPGVMVAAGAPGEQHEIGLLMLAVILRWRGWDVKYLGPNLALDRLDEAVGHLRPRLLLFTASRADSARALADLPVILNRFPPPSPKVILGGQAFAHLPDRGASIGVYLDSTPAEMVAAIETLMLAAA